MKKIELDPYPVRVMTAEDGLLLLECIENNKPFPPEKYIWPNNPLYETAPYELGFFTNEGAD